MPECSKIPGSGVRTINKNQFQVNSNYLSKYQLLTLDLTQCAQGFFAQLLYCSEVLILKLVWTRTLNKEYSPKVLREWMCWSLLRGCLDNLHRSEDQQHQPKYIYMRHKQARCQLGLIKQYTWQNYLTLSL